MKILPDLGTSRLIQTGRASTNNGAGKRSRTSGLRITNALLYQLSYAG
jgi:hypothetical protein